jgi:hypothetical protein
MNNVQALQLQKAINLVNELSKTITNMDSSFDRNYLEDAQDYLIDVMNSLDSSARNINQ